MNMTQPIGRGKGVVVLHFRRQKIRWKKTFDKEIGRLMNFSKNSPTYSFGLMLAIVSILLSLVPAGAPTHKQPPRPDVSQTNTPIQSAATSSQTPPLAREQASAAYGKLPLSFEANQGQTDKAVNFVARGGGYSLFLTPKEAVFVMSRQRVEPTPDRTDQSLRRGAARKSFEATAPAPASVLRMKLMGANPDAAVNGLNQSEGRVNYFIGNDPSKWRTNIPTFGRVRYQEVYPGIDLVYYGNQRQLEYDFVVAPGGNAQAVTLKFEGADKMSMDAAGDLLFDVAGTTIRQPKPVAYQEAAGERQAVESRYVIESDGQVGFALGAYDRQKPLIIDPVLVYSTYLGGSGTDLGNGTAVDSSGNAYVTGVTHSTNFPTANAFQGTGGGVGSGSADVFVTKLNAAGSALVYSTYLGGNSDDEGDGIAVDSSGNAYVTGFAASTNFPTTANAFQGTFVGIGGLRVFVTKLNAAGSGLVYSTYLAGNVDDRASGIAVDSSGNAYVSGQTDSTNFATVNAFQGTKGGGTDAFVT
jgi:hypothetical protein